MAELTPKDRIIFALDVQGTDEAARLAGLLKDSVGVFKIGLELFVSAGPQVVSAVRDAGGAKIFLDLKFHDIPATIAGALRSAAALKADFATVHCEGGRSLSEAAKEAASAGVNVLGVTVLTSLTPQDLIDSGIDPEYKNPLDLVLHRALLARMTGFAGVVCSGFEAKAVREKFPDDFLIITPGIRLESDSQDDQARVSTPYEAISNGADYIVVGRPIRNAPDPVKAAQAIASDVERALKDLSNRPKPL
ncbi:MAG: orotidine-5'-phosphate decarboxylase [Deltaproteobacteria bacterium]|nr:orotidine-5'-phosphate decarboxylase [Deltaproteobacteria bacterium]